MIGGVFHIIGVTSNEDFYISIDGYPFIKKEMLKEINFNYIIVTMDDYQSALKEAEILFGSQIQEKMIVGKVLQHPRFNFDKYIKILKNIPTIISNDCFAGYLYHRLGLPFQSPTINMFWTPENYYKLLCNLKEYMEKPILFKGTAWGKIKRVEYPVCSLGDIEVHMNHYETFEEAKRKWEQRVMRINYDNLLIVNHTTSEYEAERFCKLPYKNKMCFTTFQMAGCIDVSDIYEHLSTKNNMNLGSIVHASTNGRFNLYDPFEILDTGNTRKK